MSRSRKTLFSVLVIALLIPNLAFAANRSRPSISGAAVDWQAAGDFDKLQLVVTSPNGASFTREFPSGQGPTFNLKDIPEAPDGRYSWELRYIPRVSDDVKRALADARERNDDAAASKILRDNGLDTPVTDSGVFTVRGGSFVSPAQNEATPSGPRVITSDAKLRVAPDDQVIPDDLIVQGSACVGLDCVNNESFGFDTIRLKENNTRIKFDDTSTSAGFPANDWQLTANDSASGGSNKFSIEDITNSRVPFTITGAAPTNSMFVDSSGRLGLRTSTPVLDVHISTGNTPAIRQEQTNASGFTAQTWDIGANEANWFVRDVTSGSRLPLRIRPGAPTSSVDISASGFVGIGTGSPSQRLHVTPGSTGEDANTFILVDNLNASSVNAVAVVRAQADTAITNFQAHGTGRTVSRFGVTLGGWTELLTSAGTGLAIGTTGTRSLILGTNSVNRLQIDGTTGAVTVSGNFTVTGTKAFAMEDPLDAKKAIYYAALEGPEAGTYYRGTAKTIDGVAVIELPGYFSRITEPQRMTVQLTTVGMPGQPYVAEKTPGHLVIKVAKGADDVEFDYFVQGVRKGYLDFKVERDNDLPK